MILTRTNHGYSTGWTEDTRNMFSPITLFVIITGRSGLTNTAMTETVELVSHYFNRGREWCQQYINEQGYIKDFFYAILPLMMQFKEELLSKNIRVHKYFMELMDSTLFNEWVIHYDNHDNVMASAKSKLIIEELEKVFGNIIVFYPSLEQHANQNGFNEI